VRARPAGGSAGKALSGCGAGGPGMPQAVAARASHVAPDAPRCPAGHLVTPKTRATVVVALFAGPPAVVLGVIGYLVEGIAAGVVVFVVVAAVMACSAWFGGGRRVASIVRGRPADPARDARLCNLVEGLAIGAGVRQPRLRVVDSPGLNALAAGSSQGRAMIAVTTGLLAELGRVELEAVLAEELMQIRRDEALPATVLAATFGVGRSFALRPDHDAEADRGAVALTRYPPALAAALEKIDSKGAEVAGMPAGLAHLWLADPTGSPNARGRLALHERIEALREL
ncbi:MAG: M48 family metalloprotease, partial [Acidimicrobiales bacterium]